MRLLGPLETRECSALSFQMLHCDYLLRHPRHWGAGEYVEITGYACSSRRGTYCLFFRTY
jgi:hypothetical protein